MTSLEQIKVAKDRFARSINLERDAGAGALAGYLPVGRALESVDRLASALADPASEVALSVTGPYGSGKSSLALLIDALFAPRESTDHLTARSLLEVSSPAILERVDDARATGGADARGFVRCVVTARREAVHLTVLRALRQGIETYYADGGHTAESTGLLGAVSSDLARAADATYDSAGVKALVKRLAQLAPVLLLIDEFGKNLEAFAESPGRGDLFLLQELAELTRDGTTHRVALVTMQHMAFGDYADGASGNQRREWVKVQGRFEDVPFVDTAEQTRALIAASFEKRSTTHWKRVERWSEQQSTAMTRLGLFDLASQAELLAACWPLHPLTVSVLPDLCQRYGQNERTMFSFLATHEPRSVGRFLRDTSIPRRGTLPSVGLDLAYDYFVESAGGMVGVSADASRWVEIDTRIRDTQGLNAMQRQVLKTVGLLNLVSTGGSLRASREIVEYAMSGHVDDVDLVGSTLRDLEARGVLTFRDFADEYRVWQGSDVDLKSAVSAARARLREDPADLVLRRALALEPVVAARHAHQTGTLRVFDRQWFATLSGVQGLSSADRADGLLAYVIDPASVATHDDDFVKPVVVVTSTQSSALHASALDLVAIDDVLATDDAVRTDWVARRELSERRVAAAQALRTVFLSAYDHENARYQWRRPGTGQSVQESAGSASIVASQVADEFYNQAVPIRNELVNRHELSSQAAKARREVAEVMLSRQEEPHLGIAGFGPDSTLYRSVFAEFGIHGKDTNGQLGFRAPKRGKGATAVWGEIVSTFADATSDRLNLADLYRHLSLPPYGLREGVAPLLVMAVMIAGSDDLALYEHGTFRPRLNPDVCERLLRNPGNFEVKSFAANGGSRANLVTQLANDLGSQTVRKPASLVAVVGRLVAEYNSLPTYARRTSDVSSDAAALRKVLSEATEPDSLLFEALPDEFGLDALQPGSASTNWAHLRSFSGRLVSGLSELKNSYAVLLTQIGSALSSELRAPEDDLQASLYRRAEELREHVIDPRLRALVAALVAPVEGDEWLAYVGMQVAGSPPSGWTDEDKRRFEVTMRDLGASFRRIEALHADVRANGGSFEAMRVAVDFTGGGEVTRLLTIDPARRELADDVLDEVLARLEVDSGTEDEAADLLLARLLERQRSVQPRDVGADGYLGKVSSKEEAG